MGSEMCIRDSFKHNGCYQNKHQGLGGGADLIFTLFDGSGTAKSRVLVKNVTFIENCGKLGGGVYYYTF